MTTQKTNQQQEVSAMTPALFSQIVPQMIKRGMNEKACAREIGFACQIINENKQLQKTTFESRLKSVISIVGVSLTLNPLAKEMYLIPRYDKNEGGMVCHAEPSYKGLLKLLTDSGAVVSATSQIVYENDKFEIDLANGEVLHKLQMPTSKRGTMIGAYAIGFLKGGTKQVEFMDVEELNEIRAFSESYKYWESLPEKNEKGVKGWSRENYPCVWVSHYGEMCRKTVLKRLIKWLPRSGGQATEQIDYALSLSDQDFTASNRAKDYAHSLLKTSAYAAEHFEMLERKIENSTPAEINNIIDDLKENQIDPITHGSGGGQKEIMKTIAKHV